jgi:hypothetical protein
LAKAAFNENNNNNNNNNNNKKKKKKKKKKTIFTSKLDFKLNEKSIKVLHLGRSFVWC